MGKAPRVPSHFSRTIALPIKHGSFNCHPLVRRPGTHETEITEAALYLHALTVQPVLRDITGHHKGPLRLDS